MTAFNPNAKHTVNVSEVDRPLLPRKGSLVALRAVIEQGAPVTQDAVGRLIATGSFDVRPTKKDPLVNPLIVRQPTPKTVIRTGVRPGVATSEAAELFRDRLRTLLEEADIPPGDISVVSGLGSTSSIVNELVADVPPEDQHMFHGAHLLG